MILSCSNISKTFGTDQILSDVSFHINENEKVAIVGANGAGKSTLFKIIMNELSPDTGNVGFSTVPNQIISRKPHNCGFFLSNFLKNFVVYVVCRCIMWYNGYINLRCVRNLKTETVLST